MGAAGALAARCTVAERVSLLLRKSHRARLTPPRTPPFPLALAAAAQERLQPLALPLLGALRGGPLAPLLRLLLHNDSLMDISSRRQLYSQVFQLTSCLAGALDTRNEGQLGAIGGPAGSQPCLALQECLLG